MATRTRTIEYPAHSWPYVVSAFRGLAEANAHFAPMAAFVERLATSAYAAGLHPMKSMFGLRLSQHPLVSFEAEYLWVEWEDGEFVVRYQGRLGAPVWTKRDPDGMAALERLFEHLRWFTEYHGVAPRGAS